MFFLLRSWLITKHSSSSAQATITMKRENKSTRNHINGLERQCRAPELMVLWWWVLIMKTENVHKIDRRYRNGICTHCKLVSSHSRRHRTSSCVVLSSAQEEAYNKILHQRIEERLIASFISFSMSFFTVFLHSTFTLLCWP